MLTTAEATAMGIPRWMVLAMPEDVAQIVAMSSIEFQTPAQRRAARDFYLRELRRTQWERGPRKPTRRPSCLRPSKQTSGYRTQSSAHVAARRKLTPERRAEIARKGASVRWNAGSFSSL